MSTPSDMRTAVQQLVERIEHVESHLPRIGALEHREILTAGAQTRLGAEFADLRAHVFAWTGEARQAAAELNRKLDLLLVAQ